MPLSRRRHVSRLIAPPLSVICVGSLTAAPRREMRNRKELPPLSRRIRAFEGRLTICASLNFTAGGGKFRAPTSRGTEFAGRRNAHPGALRSSPSRLSVKERFFAGFYHYSRLLQPDAAFFFLKRRCSSAFPHPLSAPLAKKGGCRQSIQPTASNHQHASSRGGSSYRN